MGTTTVSIVGLMGLLLAGFLKAEQNLAVTKMNNGIQSIDFKLKPALMSAGFTYCLSKSSCVGIDYI